nr:GNAT family N-acetyltransferase [Kineosporia babensis]
MIVTSSVEDNDGEFWALYQDAFQNLRHQAVQRHLMYDTEFKEVMLDERVTKYMVRDAQTGRLVALSTMTNDLHAVPLVSPEYFQHQYPELYAQQRIWYIGFLAVAPDYQGSPAASQLIERMCADVNAADGMFVVDICEHRSRRMFAIGIERMAAQHLPNLKRKRLDAQVFWGYEFPDATAA